MTAVWRTDAAGGMHRHVGNEIRTDECSRRSDGPDAFVNGVAHPVICIMQLCHGDLCPRINVESGGDKVTQNMMRGGSPLGQNDREELPKQMQVDGTRNT